MRRSICYAEPKMALAGEVNTWKFIYTTATALPKGTRLRFDLQTYGRLIDWELPTTDLKSGENLIYAKLDKGKPISAKEIQIPDRYAPLYEFILPQNVPAEGMVTIILGSPKEIGKTAIEQGNAAQTKTQRRRAFLLHVDPSGKERFGEPETFFLDVRGNQLKNIQVVAPSFVVKNRRFDVMIRFEDEFGNLTSNTADDTLMELTHENIRENIQWRIFIPETGYIALPNLYFNETGVYTLRLTNLKTKEIFSSGPIKCLDDLPLDLHWGLLHGESERFDSTEDIENCLRHFRDDKALHFFATSSNDDPEDTSNEIWKTVSQNIADFNEEDRFCTFLGSQWEGASGSEGVRQWIFAKDNRPLIRQKDMKTQSLEKTYKLFSPKEMIAIPCFTMAKGHSYSFKNYNPEFERVVEIYNAWGSSECSIKEGNDRPIQGDGKSSIKEDPDGSIQKALLANCRFGFVGGGLDDRGVYEEFYESNQEQYTPGLTAILSPSHTREALFEALYQRSCYATTGARIVLGFFIAGIPMGQEVDTNKKRGLCLNRHITGFVAGTDEITKIEIIRNGKVFQTMEPGKYHHDFAIDDMEPLEKITLQPKDKQKPPFAYYYLRAHQKDGHMAWSSPIWIDLLPPQPKPKPVKKPS